MFKRRLKKGDRVKVKSSIVHNDIYRGLEGIVIYLYPNPYWFGTNYRVKFGTTWDIYRRKDLKFISRPKLI